jgi:hypothetical protein
MAPANAQRPTRQILQGPVKVACQATPVFSKKLFKINELKECPFGTLLAFFLD